MEQQELLPNLFKAERQKLISELRYLFAIEIEIAEDLVSDAFLSAAEFWKNYGMPQNPAAWVRTVAKNKARNHLKKKAIFDRKLLPELQLTPTAEETEIDLPQKSIDDNQLAMIFTICNPCISNEAQVGLALNLLCGFGIQEIADAFLTSKHAIYKRLERAKERLKRNRIRIGQPTPAEIKTRLDNVLTILYLLFSEGHFSISKKSKSREKFCREAMRLNYIMIENPMTNTPKANALFALMCFHSSTFAATKEDGAIIPCDEQDEALWDREFIVKGRHHLNIAAAGQTVTRFLPECRKRKTQLSISHATIDLA